jgi:hypothetical protein
MKAEQFQERRLELAGWTVCLSSYLLGGEWRCKADNISPGAALARTKGETRQEAEDRAIARAGTLLARTKRHLNYQ